MWLEYHYPKTLHDSRICRFLKEIIDSSLIIMCDWGFFGVNGKKLQRKYKKSSSFSAWEPREHVHQ
jgi:hypothetical protein